MNRDTAWSIAAHLFALTVVTLATAAPIAVLTLAGVWEWSV